MSLPPSEIPQGAIRFNTDSQRLEFYAQGEWWVMSTDTPNLGRGVDSTPGARGVFSQGFITPSPNITGRLDYINIASTGDATTFHDGTGMYAQASFSSSTRGVSAGGASPDNRNILFITLASTGEQTDSGGDLSSNLLYYGTGVSNSTRGLICGGLAPGRKSEIEYVTIASLGNSQDFGHLTADKFAMGAAASPTRGVLLGGSPSPGAQVDDIDAVTIPTLGDAQDFGTLTAVTTQGSGASNATRGVLFGGRYVGTRSKIEYVTIASLGSGVEFGDLSRTTTRDGGSVASPTRAVFAGGDQQVPTPANRVDTIDYIQISTQGNAVDFGNLTIARNHMAGMSNAHGGL